MEPPPPLMTSDATPIKSKVALSLTALQGIDYHSAVSTAYTNHHQERDRHCMVCHMSIDTLYIVITAQVLLHIVSVFHHQGKDQ